MKPGKIWIEQCEEARGIEAEFGTPQALSYLIGEKFLNFLEVAEDNVEFRAEADGKGGTHGRDVAHWFLAIEELRRAMMP